MKTEGLKKSRWRSIARKLLKGILWFLVSLILLVILVLVSIWKIVPEKTLKHILVNQVSRATGRPFQLDGIRINPFGGLDMSGITLGFTEAENVKDGALFHLDRLSLRFRLLGLLKRRIEITQVLIDGPQIRIIPLVPDSTKVKEKPAARDSVSMKPMPFSINLFSLVLSNFRMRLHPSPPSSVEEIALEGLNLHVSDLHFPNNFNEDSENIRGEIRLFSDQGQATVTVENEPYMADVHLDLLLKWKPGNQWHFTAEADVQNPGIKEGIELDADISGTAYGESVQLNRIALRLAGQECLRVRGSMVYRNPDVEFDLAIGGDGLDLRRTKMWAESLIRGENSAVQDSMDIRGILEVIEGRIYGTQDNIQFSMGSHLKNGRLSLPGLLAEEIKIDLGASGAIKGKIIENGKISARLGTGFEYAMSDSVEFNVDWIAVNLASSLDSGGLPENTRLTGDVSGLLGGTLNLDMSLRPPRGSEKGWQNQVLEGELHCDTLRLGNMPGMTPGIDGLVNLGINVFAADLDSIFLDLKVLSPGVAYPAGKDTAVTPVLFFITHAVASTDTLFSNWDLKADMAFNDLLSADISGSFLSKEKMFTGSLEKCTMINAGIPDYLPQAVLEQMQGFSVTGQERLDLHTEGRIEKESLLLTARGELKLEQIGIGIPSQGMQVKGVEGLLRFYGDMTGMEGDADVRVAHVFVEKMRPDPITGSHIGFRFGMRVPDSLWVHEGRFSIESFGVNGAFSAKAGQLQTDPVIMADLELAADMDEIRVTPEMQVDGSLKASLGVRSVDAEKQWIHVSGVIETDSLDLKGQGFQVRQASGKIPFSLDMDLKNQKAIPDPEYSPPSWIQYERFRAIYRNLSPELGTLSIREIVFADYRIEDLVMDLSLSKGFLHIPMLYLKVLGGNIGASVLVNAGTGDPGSIRYEIRAQASQINSAALTPEGGSGKEETELNASLSFQGKGVDLKQGVDVEGFFHITQIGPRFASTLLKGMDPKGTDRSIRMTRRLLDAGWKPKLFSFELRHGYVYPALELSQPWFSPVRIPGKLEYGRLPLEFFIASGLKGQ